MSSRLKFTKDNLETTSICIDFIHSVSQLPLL